VAVIGRQGEPYLKNVPGRCRNHWIWSARVSGYSILGVHHGPSFTLVYRPLSYAREVGLSRGRFLSSTHRAVDFLLAGLLHPFQALSSSLSLISALSLSFLPSRLKISFLLRPSTKLLLSFCDTPVGPVRSVLAHQELHSHHPTIPPPSSSTVPEASARDLAVDPIVTTVPYTLYTCHPTTPLHLAHPALRLHCSRSLTTQSTVLTSNTPSTTA
jgi:hypothetical protein